MPDGFGFGFGGWGVDTYLQGSGRLSGIGRLAGNIEGRYIQVTGRGEITSETTPGDATPRGTPVIVAGYATVTGTVGLTPPLRGTGNLSGSPGALTGTGQVSTSGGGNVSVSGTAQVNVTSPATLDANDTWSARVRGVGRVQGEGTTTGMVQGRFSMTGVGPVGVGIGFGPQGLFTYPRLGRITVRAEAIGTATIPTTYDGSGEVTGTVTQSAPGSKTGTGTVRGTPSIWAKGSGTVALVGR